MPASRVSSGSIVSGWGLDDLSIGRIWGPPSLLYNGYRGSFPRGKALSGRDADHSPPLSAEVRNE
jgi:hypothetical protein